MRVNLLFKIIIQALIMPGKPALVCPNHRCLPLVLFRWSSCKETSKTHWVWHPDCVANDPKHPTSNVEQHRDKHMQFQTSNFVEHEKVYSIFVPQFCIHSFINHSLRHLFVQLSYCQSLPLWRTSSKIAYHSFILCQQSILQKFMAALQDL